MEQDQGPGYLSRQSTIKVTRVPQSTPNPFQSHGPASTYHPLSDLGPPADTPGSDRSFHPTTVVPSPIHPGVPHSGPAQLLMSRLYNKPENSDVLVNVRRHEQMRLGDPNVPRMVGVNFSRKRFSMFWTTWHKCR